MTSATFRPAVATCLLLLTTVCRGGVDAILFVDDDAPDGGDGLAWTTAFRSLQDALHAVPANAEVEIRIANGIYRPDDGVDVIEGSRFETFLVPGGVTLAGGYAGIRTLAPDERSLTPLRTVLCGDLESNDAPSASGARTNDASRLDNSFHVVTTTGIFGEKVLDGLVIQRGHATNVDQEGGGIFALGGGTIRSCAVLDNFAVLRGGGVHAPMNVTINDTLFERNDANVGGAFYQYSGAGDVRRCTFRNNVGPAASIRSTATGLFEDCLFEENVSILNAGAVSLDGPGTFTRCIFRENRCTGWGGAIYGSNQGHAQVFNCLFDRNAANGRGGSILALNGVGVLAINCTFVGNEAQLGSSVSAGAGAAATLLNCVLWNALGEESDTFQEGTVTITYSNVQGGAPGVGNLAVDPRFIDAAVGNARLQSTSPCIDTGTDIGDLLDLDGRPREVDGDDDGTALPDMGAYEYAFIDCNGNGVHDGDDVADGAADCNRDNVPDECEGEADCDGNGIPDECDTIGGINDCNGNGLPDACDLASGVSEDCNGDGMPDDCPAPIRADFSTPQAGPFGWGEPQVFQLPAPPAARDRVSIRVDFRSELTHPDAAVYLSINGGPAFFLASDAAACDSIHGRWRDYDMDLWNELIAGRPILSLRVFASPEVDPFACTVESSIQLRFRYFIPGNLDCNGNFTRDDCDIASGVAADCDENGVPDSCDIASGDLPDIDANGVADGCQDCNDNGLFDPDEIAAGDLDDCDGDGVPDACQVTTIVSEPSGLFAPVAAGAVYRLEPRPLPAALDDVELRFEAFADLSFFLEVIEVSLNGTSLGSVFELAGADCTMPLSLETLVIPAEQFNALTNDGADVRFEFVPSEAVEAEACLGLSYFETVLWYRGRDLDDGDDSGVPDLCECRADLNGDDVVDALDLLALIAAWDTDDPIADISGDGVVDAIDLLAMIAGWGGCPG